MALPQPVLCINRLSASCWFDYVQPLEKQCNGVQSRSEVKDWITHTIKSTERKNYDVSK
jgi:hypothetical protein